MTLAVFAMMVFMALPQLLSAQQTKAQELRDYMGGVENIKKIAPVGEYNFRFTKGSFPRVVDVPDRTFLQVMLGPSANIPFGDLQEIVYQGMTLPRGKVPYGKSAVVDERTRTYNPPAPPVRRVATNIEDPRIAQMQQQMEKQAALMEKLLAAQQNHPNGSSTKSVATQDSVLDLLGLDDLQKKEYLLNGKFLEELNRVSADSTTAGAYEKAAKFRNWMKKSGNLVDEASRPWILTVLYELLNGVGKFLIVVLVLAFVIVRFGNDSMTEFFTKLSWGRAVIGAVVNFFKTITALIAMIVIFAVWLFVFIYDRAWLWTWSEIFWSALIFILVMLAVANMIDPASSGKWYSVHRKGLSASNVHEGEVVGHS